MTSIPVPQTPTDQPPESVEERFGRLAAVWQRETAFLSSMDAADRQPAYQDILRLGPAVVPLLLRDLEAHHT